MCDSVPEGDETDGRSDEYVFSCPTCEQEITVNVEMKRAIISHGCPVCTVEVSEDDFDTQPVT